MKNPWQKWLLGFAVVMLVVGLASFVPALNFASTIWQVIVLSSIPSGSSVDSTIHQVVCVDPNTGVSVNCVATPAPTVTPIATPSLPLSQANGGTGASSLNAANIAQTLITQAGNPLTTLAGFTYGVQNTLTSWTMPAGTLGPYDVMKCHAYGDFQNNTGGTILFQPLWLSGPTGATVISNSSAVSPTTNTALRGWISDFTFANEGATNTNFIDGFWSFGGANGVIGADSNVLGSPFGGFSQATFDTAANQTFKLNVIVGVATPAATPTASPTAASTPATRLIGFHCWKLPGTTPTPTLTPTPAPT